MIHNSRQFIIHAFGFIHSFIYLPAAYIHPSFVHSCIDSIAHSFIHFIIAAIRLFIHAFCINAQKCTSASQADVLTTTITTFVKQKPITHNMSLQQRLHTHTHMCQYETCLNIYSNCWIFIFDQSFPFCFVKLQFYFKDI